MERTAGGKGRFFSETFYSLFKCRLKYHKMFDQNNEHSCLIFASRRGFSTAYLEKITQHTMPERNRKALQSGASSPAKHGDAYFSAVYGSIHDPIAALGPYENQEP